MKGSILFILPNSPLYMPYIDMYLDIFKNNHFQFTVIYWNRTGNEYDLDILNKIEYKDKKNTIKRSFFDYFNFHKYINRHLSENKYTLILIFSLPSIFFMQKILLSKKYKFILDIRDYHKTIRFMKLKKIIDLSLLTVISSEGYKLWLPKSEKYLINHNTFIDKILQKSNFSEFNKKDILNISYIGQLNHLQSNLRFIDNFKNNSFFDLYFIGNGSINDTLLKYVETNSIFNVKVFGEYKREEEEQLYEKSDLTNLILNNNNINNKTCLANRLYKSAYYYKPIIIYGETYMSNIIKKYNLGVVLDSKYSVISQINEYIRNLDEILYEEGRDSFFRWVFNENSYFRERILKIISGGDL